MKPPSGKEIGIELVTGIFRGFRDHDIRRRSHPLKTLEPFLAELTDIIPPSVVKDGIPAQVAWLYKAYRKGTHADCRINTPHESIIRFMVQLFREIQIGGEERKHHLIKSAALKKSRANRKGAKVRIQNWKKDEENAWGILTRHKQSEAVYRKAATPLKGLPR